MAKRIWEFQSLSQIGDDTKFLVSQGENTRVVPGALINQISNRIDSIIKGTSDAVSAAEIADARVQPNRGNTWRCNQVDLHSANRY